MQRLKSVFMLRDKINDIVLRYHLPVHPYPFAEINQMRRGVQPDLIARLPKNGGEQMADRAFAVGAGYVDGLVCLMRIAEVIVQCRGNSQSRLVGGGTASLENGGTLKQVPDRFFVGHELLDCFFRRRKSSIIQVMLLLLLKKTGRALILRRCPFGASA